MDRFSRLITRCLAVGIAMLAVIFLPLPLSAEEEELGEKLRILLEELEDLKSEAREESKSDTHLHGYGELHYNNTDLAGEKDRLDFHRMVIGLMYSFDERLVLDLEVDFEHAASELELEYAHLSFLISDELGVRAGSLLMPVGFLNEHHEPPLFFSVERPYVERSVIPTTWQEGGAGIFGSAGAGVGYRFYLVGGLDARGFTGPSGIRGGRGKVADAPADDLALVGRVDYTARPGMALGASGYWGGASQGEESLEGADVGIIEGDGRWEWEDFELAGLLAVVKVDETEKIRDVAGEIVGETILGWYIEAAYHLGRSFLPEGMDMVAFLRHERLDTQNETAPGLPSNPANDRRVTTIGTAFYPDHRVALKADLELWRDGGEGSWTQANLGVGYMF